MGFGLAAPVAVPVEVRSAGRRVFRLSVDVGEGGIRLARPAPFDIGRPVEVRFALPDAPLPFALKAELATTGADEERDGEAGGCGLLFLAASEDVRHAVNRYVRDRLGLPPI